MRGARAPLGRKTKERAAEVSGLQLSRVSPIPEAQAKSAGVAYCGKHDRKDDDQHHEVTGSEGK
jgi:hypothetical protein